MRIHKMLLCSCVLALGASQAQTAAPKVQAAAPKTQAAVPVPLPDELAALTARTTTKKLIEYGWDMPTPQTLQANQERLAAAPFDGLTLRLSGSQLIFRRESLDAAQVSRDVAALKSLSSNKLANSYLSMYGGAEGGWDWASEGDWAQTERSVRLMAGAARAAGLRGIMFDVEPYTGNPWSYSLQPGARTMSFEALSTRVRSRGAAFMRAAQSEFPGIELYGLFLLSANKYDMDGPASEQGQRLRESGYGLWPAFVNGMLDAIGPGVKLTEGNEQAYDYLHAAEFEGARRTVRQGYLSLVAPENRAKYTARVGMGQAIFADGVLNVWKSPRFTGYYFPGDAVREQTLGHNIVQALRTTDEVAWFYNEHFDWWATPKSGQERLRGVIQSARQVARAGKTIPPVASLSAVEAAYKARVSVGGDLRAGGDVTFEVSGTNYPAGQNPFCATWDAGRRYGCTFPGNWSGTVRPNVGGKFAFDPPERTYRNLKKDDWQAHFTFKP